MNSAIFLICSYFFISANGGFLEMLGIGGPQGPKPEEGECSFWRANEANYANLDAEDLTAFHRPDRTIRIGSYLQVYNDDNNKSVSVRVIGYDETIPEGRVLDMSPAAFSAVSRLTSIVFPCTVVKPTASAGGLRPSVSNQGQGQYPSGHRPGGQYSGGQGYGNPTRHFRSLWI